MLQGLDNYCMYCRFKICIARSTCVLQGLKSSIIFSFDKSLIGKIYFREIAIFDTDDSLVRTFSNSVFLYPCAVEFNANKREAYILGKLFSYLYFSYNNS